MRSATVSPILGALLIFATLTTSPRLAEACDPLGQDAAAIALVRAEIRQSCECRWTPTRAPYLDCTASLIANAIESGGLPASCEQELVAFAEVSSCGLDQTITCCSQNPDGSREAFLGTRVRGCDGPPGSSSCRGYYGHLADACLPDGTCRPSECGDGLVSQMDGESCEPPGVGFCDTRCHTIICGNGMIDEHEECDPPNTTTCDYNCQSRNCGDGIVESNEQCEPPGTPSCDDLCAYIHECGNGALDPLYSEECEPPGTASCDDTCQLIHDCGDGVIERGEECDGQPGCSSDCKLIQRLCCDLGPGCFDGTATDPFGEYRFFKPCYTFGTGSYGICDGTDPCEGVPDGIGCRRGSCTNSSIEPLPLCCESPDGTCRDTIATTASDAGGFDCLPLQPPGQGEVPRLVVGRCGAGGTCIAATARASVRSAPWHRGGKRPASDEVRRGVRRAGPR